MKKYLMIMPLLSMQCFAVTLSEWQKYTTDQKINYISNKPSDVDISLLNGSVRYSRLTLPRFEIVKKKLTTIQKTLSSFKTRLDTDVNDDLYAQVGSIRKSADLFFSDDNHFLGAQIQYFQAGCSHKDSDGEYIERGGHYTNVTEAMINNCFDNDVSWSGYSVIDHKFKEIQYSDFMEWSGH